MRCWEERTRERGVCVCDFMRLCVLGVCVAAAASLSYEDRRRGELERLSLRLTDWLTAAVERRTSQPASGWNWQWVLSKSRKTSEWEVDAGFLLIAAKMCYCSHLLRNSPVLFLSENGGVYRVHVCVWPGEGLLCSRVNSSIRLFIGSHQYLLLSLYVRLSKQFSSC